MGLELILRKAGRNSELADSSAEACRGASRQFPDIDRDRSGIYALADGSLAVVEETVKYAVTRPRGSPDIDKADKLGRLDGELACLLGNEHIASEQG